MTSVRSAALSIEPTIEQFPASVQVATAVPRVWGLGKYSRTDPSSMRSALGLAPLKPSAVGVPREPTGRGAALAGAERADTPTPTATAIARIRVR